MSITFLTNEDKDAIIELLNNLSARIDDVEDNFNSEINDLREFVGYDADNPDEGDEGDEGDVTTITFSVGDPDGGAEYFSVPAGTTWEEFAGSEDNLATCEDCGEEKPVITISGGYVYCDCVFHTPEGVRRCADCEGGFRNVYYFDDEGSEIPARATALIKAEGYYCDHDSTTINFYIEAEDLVKCTAGIGMTWGEWMNSGMAPEEVYFDGDMLWYGSCNDDNGITLDDGIIAGKTYYFTPN